MITATPIRHRSALSTAGQQKLQTFLEQGRTLLAFDFDGTLAPIVAHPRSARAPLAVVRALKSLLAMHEVAVLSGRSVDDLRARLGFAPHHLIGNHGAEDPGSELSRTQSATFRARLAPLREAAAGEWAEVLSTLGISMEDRGLSLSFHYRLSRDREAARVLIAEMLQAEGQGIRAFDGKLVIHVMAVEAPGKLEALRTLMARQGLERVLYAGDDPSDEAVFRQQGPGWFTLLVGGDARLSAAGFHLNATSDMPLFLAACRRCLRRSTG